MQADDTQTSISLRNQISLYPKEGGAIVFVNDTGEYLQVNEIGRIILDGLMCGTTIEDCTNKIAEESQADRQIIARDADRFLADMGKHVRL